MILLKILEKQEHAKPSYPIWIDNVLQKSNRLSNKTSYTKHEKLPLSF